MSEVATEKTEETPQADAQTAQWKNREGEFVPMSEMSDQEILEARKHCLKKMGQHSKRLIEARASLRKFGSLWESLGEECAKRDLYMESDVPDDELEKLNFLVSEVHRTL